MRKLCLAFLAVLSLAFGALSEEVKAYMDELAKEAKAKNPNFSGFDAKRGELVFTTKGKDKDGAMINCQSCHSADLSKASENIYTLNSIEPLSPKANPARLMDAKEVQKWLKRNFKDVYSREGSALEKGDVLEYILKF